MNRSQSIKEFLSGWRFFSAACALFLFLILFSCDSEDAPDCVQTAGEIVRREIAVEPFDRLIVNARVGVTIKQGTTQNILLVTGENLLEEVEFTVINGTLEIKNENACNLLRDYGITNVTVTVPDLKEIRSSTGLDVVSDGILDFDTLRLISTDGPEEDFYFSNGNFRLELDVDHLEIETSNLSNFYLSGRVENADLNWLNGDGRLLGEQLIIENATIFHRGTNDWFLNVTNSIEGIINGYGNVYLPTAPVSVDVQQPWRGRLIIN
jgi:hypothetical protein